MSPLVKDHSDNGVANQQNAHKLNSGINFHKRDLKSNE